MCEPWWDTGALQSADDAVVVAAISEWTRAEAVASARRLAAIAEWVRRYADGPTDCAHWSCDNWDAMAAEVGAAQGISHRMASGQMYLAVALHNRLPRVAALFRPGDDQRTAGIDDRVAYRSHQGRRDVAAGR
jgi:hypothetical protein